MEGQFRVQEWGGTPKHLKAMGVHRGLAIFYGVVAALVLAAAAWHSRVSEIEFGVLAVFAVPVAIHAFIALGASKASRIAQFFSVVVAVLMLAAVPIGTVIGIYLLRNAGWSRKPV